MRPTAALALLMAAYLTLSLVYAAKTPYRQAGHLKFQGGAPAIDIGAPDERQHANYVQGLLEGKGFPVLRPGSPDLGETYQAHQPPAYYVLAAGWATLGAAEPDEASSGLWLRSLNSLIGLGTLLAIFLTARWGLGNDGIGLAAVAFAGLMPMFVALHGAVSNDPLLFLCCSWTVALLARAARGGWTWRLGLGIGLVVGLGLLTKTTALALLPTVLVALVASRRLSGHAASPACWALALVVPLAVASPWMARNQSLYGDPFAVSAFNRAFVGSPRPQDVVVPSLAQTDPTYNEAALRAQARLPEGPPKAVIDAIVADVGMTGKAKAHYWLDWVGWWTARSFVGVFGYMDVFLFEGMGPEKSAALYRFVLALLALCAFAWPFSIREADGPARLVHLAGGTLLAVVVVLFVRFNLQYFQGQARYLYPAVCPISLGLAGGLWKLLGRHKDWAWAVAAGFLLVIQWFALFAVTQVLPSRLN